MSQVDERTTTGGEPIYQWWILLVCLAGGLCCTVIALAVIVIDPRLPGQVPRPPDRGNTIFELEGAIALGILAAIGCWILVVVDRMRTPAPGSPPLRTVLGIAALLSASVSGGFLALLLFQAELTGAGAPPSLGTSLDLTFQLITFGSLAAAPLFAVFSIAARVSRDPRRAERCRQVGRVVLLVVLLGPFLCPPGFTLARAVPVDVAACVVTTALALWVVHGMQRHRRLPFRMLAAGFAWGGLVAFGFGVIHGATAMLFVPGIVRHAELSGYLVLGVAPAVSEELGKFAGIVIVYLLARRHIDNVVSGLVIGAAVGLGFNFTESVLYMTTSGPEFSHWTRQGLGILTSHASWTALSGAGLAIAVRMRAHRHRRLAIFAGLGVAICAHSANNYLGSRMNWWYGLSDNTWVTTLLLTPGMMIMLQAPFAVGYILLLRHGLKEQHAALRVALPAEADTGSGAITPDEVDDLLDPSRRFRIHVDTLRRHGFAAYRRSARLHAAQLDLAMLRRRHDGAAPAAALDTARSRVLRLKAPARPATAVPLEVAG